MRPIASPLREVNRSATRTASAAAVGARTAELSESEALKGAILESALDCVVALTDEAGSSSGIPPPRGRSATRARTALGRPLAELIAPPEFASGTTKGSRAI